MPLLTEAELTQKTFAEHPFCRKWMMNHFPSNRLETVVLLLNSLRLVSHTEFERSLIGLITKTGNQLKGKIALYCARELPPGMNYFPGDMGIAPSAVTPGNEVGSEGRLAHIARNIAREAPKKFLSHPSVSDLRKVKCHEIFILDDLIGSGERIVEFAAALNRDPHLKSWISGRLVRITVIAYSVSRRGEQAIRQDVKGLGEIKFECRPSAGSVWWSQEKRQEVQELCRTFGRRTRHPDASLGYKDSFSLIVFEHGCPDNVPSILWSTGNWSALFKHRSIPIELSDCFDLKLSSRTTRSGLAFLGQTQLAGSSWIKRAGSDAQAIVLVLAAVSKKLRNLDRMSEYTGLSNTQCEQSIKLGIQYGLLTPGPYLTPLGLEELRRLKATEKPQKEVADAGEPFYYPHALRGPGAI